MAAELTVPTLHAEKVFEIAGVPITNSIIGTWIALVVLFALSYVAVRRPALVPTGVQNVFEMGIDGFRGLVRDVMEDESQVNKFLPLVLGIFLFVLVTNWIGLLPGFGTIGFFEHGNHEEFVPFLRGGSGDLNLTLALAAVSFLVAQAVGIIRIGFLKYSGKFFNIEPLVRRPFKVTNVLLAIPTFLLGLIELISELAKLISLSFRLFGNIYAGEVLLVVFGFLLPLYIPLSGPFYLLEFFVGLIQAFVFAMLTIVFIKIATIEPH
jgi:F-type H+-transporting ATPase subunit a